MIVHAIDDDQRICVFVHNDSDPDSLKANLHDNAMVNVDLHTLVVWGGRLATANHSSRTELRYIEITYQVTFTRLWSSEPNLI